MSPSILSSMRMREWTTFWRICLNSLISSLCELTGTGFLSQEWMSPQRRGVTLISEVWDWAEAGVKSLWEELKVFSCLFPMALCFPLPTSPPGSFHFLLCSFWDTLPTFELNFADSFPSVISPNTCPCGLTFLVGQLDWTTPHSTHLFPLLSPPPLQFDQSAENFILFTLTSSFVDTSILLE